MGSTESKVADLNLAARGRTEIELAEEEMPGLMELRKASEGLQPLKGARISGCLHMTVQTAVFIETLRKLGAEIRWCSSNVLSTQDHAASAIAQSNSCSVFAWKGETSEEYYWCIKEALCWPDNAGPNLIVDDGGDLLEFIQLGLDAEQHLRNNNSLKDWKIPRNPETESVCEIIEEVVTRRKKSWSCLVENIRGVSEQTTLGGYKLRRLKKSGNLRFPAINVNDSVTKSKFDNIYGCKHSLPDAIMRATDVLIAGKSALICGFGDVGKGCASAMRGCGAKVYVSEIDPICALQASMEGYTVCTVDSVVSQIDIFVTATGNVRVITVDHMRRMKNNAIVCNIGHFNCEFDVEGLDNDSTVRKTKIKDQVHRYQFTDKKGILVLAEGRLVNLGCATGHPSFVMSCSFTNQVLAVLELWNNKQSNKYKADVYTLPKTLDEAVARFHLEALGAELTILTDEQAAYLDVPKAGPMKLDSYRY